MSFFSYIYILIEKKFINFILIEKGMNKKQMLYFKNISIKYIYFLNYKL